MVIPIPSCGSPEPKATIGCTASEATPANLSSPALPWSCRVCVTFKLRSQQRNESTSPPTERCTHSARKPPHHTAGGTDDQSAGFTQAHNFETGRRDCVNRGSHDAKFLTPVVIGGFSIAALSGRNLCVWLLLRSPWLFP